jgi:hypothetical protein
VVRYVLAGGEFVRFFLALSVSIAALSSQAFAEELVPGGKLLLTRGVSNVEGSGGGGLSTWALITGNETDVGIGGTAFATNLGLSDYDLRAVGGAIGFYDRLEISYAHQEFDTGGTGAKLGIGKGYKFNQNAIGLKLRLVGDAVYDQDKLLPQIAVGVQWKHNKNEGLVRALGATNNKGADYYISATKVLLGQSLLLGGAVRFTKANQFGILGFGGDREDDYSAQFEGTIGYLASDGLLLGAEVRTKPDNLGFAKEEAAYDAYAAYAITHNLTVTVAYVDLGSIATFEDQRGLYFSLQAGF